jgi:pyrroline-5-carboxylate reductase
MLIAFIGGGNMATALISGLTEPGSSNLVVHVSEPNEAARVQLQSNYRCFVFDNSAEAVRDADVIVLAVKPQVIPLVLIDLSGEITPDQLVLSIAAGTTVSMMENQLGMKQPIIRSMPNTPALVNEGITGMFASENCKPHHREQAERILKAVGEVIWLESESLMDAVTAISGSGPAYFFLLTEALTEAGIKLGLPKAVSRQLAEKTCTGAGIMLRNSDEDAAELRRRVTSPGGTTQAALEAFASGSFNQLVFKAAEAAEKRGNELSKDTG